MVQILSDKPISEAEWEALEDPPHGRYEIIDGALTVNPSQSNDHSRLANDLVMFLRCWLPDIGLGDDFVVTYDVEWRTGGPEQILHAPRGDVVLGPNVLHPKKGIHIEKPLLVAEVWSPRTPPSVERERRLMWSNHGVEHYWDVRLDYYGSISITVFDFTVQAMPIAVASDDEELQLTAPFAVSFAPSILRDFSYIRVRKAALADRQIAQATRETEAATREAAAAMRKAEASRRRIAALEQELAELRGRGDDDDRSGDGTG